MKKLLFLALCTASLSCYALPTYEPFTEFAATIASNPTNLVAVSSNGVPLGTNALGSITNCIDLATGGYTAPGGELWGSLNFTGTSGTNIHGVDIAVISNANIFTSANLTGLLPATFPGMPVSGQAITNLVENPAQPFIYYVVTTNTTTHIVSTNFGASPNIVGNSAVLKFAQPITRPASGTQTVFVSYLLSVAQQGQLGAGNDGRYMAFLSQTNLAEGTGSGGAYTNWASMFNTYNGSSASGVHYASHGLILKSANVSYYIGACDSVGPKEFTSSSFFANFNAPSFIVGAYLLNSGTNNDTNVVWVNPSLGSFGGVTPPLSPIMVDTMTNFNMSDLAGLVLIDRVGSGGLGGLGTNYIANLLIGTTWSYVTGGPEFTNAPATNTYITSYGQNVTISGMAVAAGQGVAYQWQKVVAGVTNSLSDGTGTAGGTAIVSGSSTSTLTLNNVSSGDMGIYQVQATANGTGYTLAAPTVLSLYVDPHINSVPDSITTNYGGTATFAVQISTFNAPLTYGWSKNGTPLANGAQTGGSVASNATGTTGAGTNFALTLTLANVSYLDDGSYTLNVTNASNQNSSSASASLTVIDPIIATQPQTNIMVVSAGGTTNFSVVAAGTTPLTYQWYGQLQGQLSDGSTFTGSTNSTLMVANAQPANSDNYYVIVSGPGGAIQSSNAIVFVNSTNLGPFSPSSWPSSIAGNSVVEYTVVDPTLGATFSATAPPNWTTNVFFVASGGDQTYTTTTLDGLQCHSATGANWNWADLLWRRFASIPQIDILLLVYGNSDLYNATNGGLPTQFSYGIAAAPTTVAYETPGTYPLGANNGQWNWILLSVTNVPDINGVRTIGDQLAQAHGGASGIYGGINNGTIRLDDFTDGMAIAAFAIGAHGAFGTSNQVNRFSNPASCSPEPSNNLAFIDFNQNLTNNLVLMNNPSLGETYTVQSGIGPSNDLRTAIQPSGQLEPLILSNYLGLPCNENLSMQLCLEVYDDPALAGTEFQPYQYATDSQGDLQTFTGPFYTLTGSGQWLKIAFYFGPANLQGVDAAPLTGGCTVLFFGGNPYIDRVELGVIRTGTNALAGQIPDPSYNLAPLVTCSNGYGYYAEWYPSAGITNNLNIPGSYTTTNGIGPANDKRIAEVPIPISSGSACYEQFALLNNVFGPVYQDNADVIMSVDYYDDPALTNNDLYPNAYETLANGSVGIISPQSPYGTPVFLAGTGKWQTATWELPNVNFTGAYLCRFASSAPIYISRVRFDVIRPCGTFKGIDYLQSLGMTKTNTNIGLNWFGQATLQSAPVVTGAYTNIVTVTNTVTNIYTVPMTNQAGFFRLQFPAYPSYLSTNTP